MPSTRLLTRAAGAGAIAVALLAGCAAKGGGSTAPSKTTTPPLTLAPIATTTRAPSPSAAKPTTAIGGADTPETAATAYLRAWAEGDPTAICRLTTDDAKRVVVQTPEAMKSCVDAITRNVEKQAPAMAPLKAATVTKVVAQGPDSARVDPAGFVPPEAADLVGKMTLQQVKGRWFVRLA